MSESITAQSTYLLVYLGLVTLTVISVAASFLPLGLWHAAVGLSIATVKGLLVALFFMHLLHSTRLSWAVALGGLFWLGILLSLTLTDYLTRGWLAY